MDIQIAGLQKFSLIDYPGHVAAIIFTRGCGFRCDFCHNPELVDPKRYAPLLPVSEVLDFLKRRKGQLEGVVVTGGDPTIQAGLIPFLQQLKKLNYLVKLDTTGVWPDVLKEVMKAQLVDYWAMDLKGPLAKYQSLTHSKVQPEQIRASVELIMHCGQPYEFRTTVVKGLLSVDEVVEIGRSLIYGADCYVLQHFIPQHTLNPAFLQRVTWSEAELEDAKDRLKQYVCVCDIR